MNAADFDCSICRETSSMMFQCQFGHLHCVDCIDQLNSTASHARNILPFHGACCSVCRTVGPWSYPLTLFNVLRANDAQFECPHTGCNARFGDRRDHAPQRMLRASQDRVSPRPKLFLWKTSSLVEHLRDHHVQDKCVYWMRTLGYLKMVTFNRMSSNTHEFLVVVDETHVVEVALNVRRTYNTNYNDYSSSVFVLSCTLVVGTDVRLSLTHVNPQDGAHRLCEGVALRTKTKNMIATDLMFPCYARDNDDYARETFLQTQSSWPTFARSLCHDLNPVEMFLNPPCLVGCFVLQLQAPA